jgi:hypothetical protein
MDASVCTEGSDLFVFADDAKLVNHINDKRDAHILQTDLNSMDRWFEE